MALSTEDKYEIAVSQATANEQTYISNPTKKNYTWVIVIVTIAVIAGSAYYFYKH